MWVNKRHAAQQVAIPSSDVVAVSIATKRGIAMVMSAYDLKSTDGQAASGKRRAAPVEAADYQGCIRWG
jgi:hypothetical protein